MSVYENLLEANADPEMTKAAWDADHYERRLDSIDDFLENATIKRLPWAKEYGEKVRNRFLHGSAPNLPDAEMV